VNDDNLTFHFPSELGDDMLQFEYMLDSEFLSLLPFTFEGNMSVDQ
jgi:hypothetical protein